MGAYVVSAALSGPESRQVAESQGAQPNFQVAPPTHDRPTQWGEFLIVPIFAPASPGPSETFPQPAPTFGPDAKRSGLVGGADADAKVESQVPEFVGLPDAAKQIVAARGLALVSAEASANADGSFVSGLLYGRTEPSNAMLQLSVITVVNPLRITEFPHTPIYDFVASYAVAGNPTITKFPSAGTSDASGDREVRWSQDGKAFLLKTFGPFSDDEVLEIANEVSQAEGDQR